MGPDSRPKWVRIHRSSVNGRPICASLGTDPFGSVLVETRSKSNLECRDLFYDFISNEWIF